MRVDSFYHHRLDVGVINFCNVCSLYPNFHFVEFHHLLFRMVNRVFETLTIKSDMVYSYCPYLWYARTGVFFCMVSNFPLYGFLAIARLNSSVQILQSWIRRLSIHQNKAHFLIFSFRNYIWFKGTIMIFLV